MNWYHTIGKRTSRRYKEPVHEWAQADTEEFKDEDFDFQGNLGLFDKARVFAEIRVSLQQMVSHVAIKTILILEERNDNDTSDHTRVLTASHCLTSLM